MGRSRPRNRFVDHDFAVEIHVVQAWLGIKFKAWPRHACRGIGAQYCLGIKAVDSARSIASVLKNFARRRPARRAEAVLDAKTNANACLGAGHGGAREQYRLKVKQDIRWPSSVDLASSARLALWRLLIRRDRGPPAGSSLIPTARTESRRPVCSAKLECLTGEERLPVRPITTYCRLSVRIS